MDGTPHQQTYLQNEVNCHQKPIETTLIVAKACQQEVATVYTQLPLRGLTEL